MSQESKKIELLKKEIVSYQLFRPNKETTVFNVGFGLHEDIIKAKDKLDEYETEMRFLIQSESEDSKRNENNVFIATYTLRVKAQDVSDITPESIKDMLMAFSSNELFDLLNIGNAIFKDDTIRVLAINILKQYE